MQSPKAFIGIVAIFVVVWLATLILIFTTIELTFVGFIFGLFIGTIGACLSFLLILGLKDFHLFVIPIGIGLFFFNLNAGFEHYSTIEREPPKTVTKREPIGNRAWDGTVSSATGPGAASHHGGVKKWLYKEWEVEATERDLAFWEEKQRERYSATMWRFYLSFVFFLAVVFNIPSSLAWLKTKGDNKTQHRKSDRAGGSEA